MASRLFAHLAGLLVAGLPFQGLPSYGLPTDSSAADSALRDGLGADSEDASCGASLLQHRQEERHTIPGKTALAAIPAPPAFVVDLDVAPEERWKEVILYYKQLGAVAALTAKQPDSPQMDAEDKQAWLDAVRPLIDEEFMREIDGWVKYAGAANLTRDSMIVSQFMYEQNFPTFCSAILAAMPNGTVVHGRNMDYEVFAEHDGKKWTLQEMTVDIVFTRGGKPLITSVLWPGQLGIHTAMRFDGWSFDQQTRTGKNDMRLNLAAAQQGSQGYSLLVRRIMERVPDFETAVQELYSASFMAPQYFILVGRKPYEGAVLTIDRGGNHEDDSPPIVQLNKTAKQWHLLQTNDDQFHPPLDGRRPITELKLSVANQAEVSTDWVAQHMRAFPLTNSKTVFSWIAVPATGYHQTLINNNPPPYP